MSGRNVLRVHILYEDLMSELSSSQKLLVRRCNNDYALDLLQQPQNLPPFGGWDIENGVPYTVYFENVRKGKSRVKTINPGDRQENPEMFSDSASPGPPFRTKKESKKPKGIDSTGRGVPGRSPYQERGGNRPIRSSVGLEHTTDQSPLHPNQQAKLKAKGRGIPAWEGKNSNENGQTAPGRSRMKPSAKGDDFLDGGAVLPKFEDWDDKDPKTAEEYTDIFDTARRERASGFPKVSPSNSKPSHATDRKEKAQQNKICCFPWFSQ